MTDVFFVAIILLIAALVAVIWLSRRQKKEAQGKPSMPLVEFFVTFLALINSFIVIILGISYIHGTRVAPSWLIAGTCLALGIAGIVLAFVDNFRKRKSLQSMDSPKSIKKPK